MKQELSSSKKKTSFWIYLFIYFLIIGSDCILFSYNRNEALPRYSQYFMVFLALLFLSIKVNKNKYRIQKKDIFLFVTIISLIFSAFIHNEFRGGYISIISLFILGSSLFDIIDSNKFVKIFLNLMTIICIVSLFTFFFSSFISKLPFFPSIYNNLNREYKFFFFSNVLMINPERNFGLFTEPSRFQAYINLGLIFMMFTNEKKLDIKRIVLFVVCLITTFSTTGYIAFAIILAAFIFSGKVRIKTVYKAIIVLVIIAAFYILLSQSESFFNSVNKLALGQQSLSASTRFNSFFATLKIISENFFFGTGITNAEYAFKKALSDLGGVFASTNTMTLLIIFSKFGFMPGLFYAVNMCKAVKNISNNKSTLILIIAFIAMTSGISFIESIIFNIIIFYRNPELQKCEQEININENIGN